MTLSVQIQHRFPGFDLDVDFSAPGGATALFGRSGSGKTTIVNAVAGLLRPDGGRIMIDGQPVFDADAGRCLPPHKRRVGYVFQDGRLFPHLTVNQNLKYGRWFSGNRQPRAEYDDVLSLLGLERLVTRRPGSLSGGEQQRVAIGRALLSAPRVLLLDEPLAALDEARKAEILPYLDALQRHAEIPILYVSHSIAEVARLARTMVLLKDGQVVQSGPVDAVLSNPAMVPIVGVRSAGALLLARLKRHCDDGLSELALPGGGRLFLPAVAGIPGQEIRVRVPAQDVMLSLTRPENLSALNILQVVISDIRQGDGPGAMVRLRFGDGQTSGHLLARITRRSVQSMQLHPDMTVYAVIKSVAVAHGDVSQQSAG